MNINNSIKKHQDALVATVNNAGAELPPKIVQLLIQNVLYQVDMQVIVATQKENAKESGEKTEQ